MSNDEYTYEIKPVKNGYIVDKQTYHRRDDNITEYNSEKNICLSWQEVLDFLKDNGI